MGDKAKASACKKWMRHKWEDCGNPKTLENGLKVVPQACFFCKEEREKELVEDEEFEE